EGSAYADQDAGDETDDGSARGADESARRGDRHETREKAVTGHRRVGLSLADPHVEEGSEGPRAARQHGGDGDGSDAQIAVRGGAQRTARNESEPAEGEDEAADQDRRDVVSDDRVGRSVAGELADARTD